jgi:RHS repeat-associated protein
LRAELYLSSGTVHYFVSDHIGNVRIVTDASGVKKEESDYYPFGGERTILTDTLDNTYKFTGMERDGEAAVLQDHTLHRQYYPSHGRWMSPDPVPGSPDNPQSWNRYAYVLNDPLDLVDPLGSTGYGSTFICIPNPAITGPIWGCDWREGCTPGTLEVPLIPGKSLPGSPVVDLLGFAHQELGGLAGDGLLNFELGPDGLLVGLYLDSDMYDFLTERGIFELLLFQGEAACPAGPYALPCIGANFLLKAAAAIAALAAALADYLASENVIHDHIMEQARELMSQFPDKFPDICDALKFLYDQARAEGNNREARKIKATQKGNDCREHN